MDHPRFPRTAKALEAYGPNLYVQAQKTGIPYTTLREWFLHGRRPNLERLVRFPDLVLALTEDIVAQTDSTCVEQPTEVSA
jgi:hypothetical protein